MVEHERERNDMTICLFGCGKYYRRYHHLFDGMQVAAIIDNFSSAKSLDGLPILRPDKLVEFNFDRIYLLVEKDFPVYQQLMRLGVPCEKIVRVHDLFRLKGFPCFSFPSAGRREKECRGRGMLISNGFSRTGAPMVLTSAASILRDHGYDVTVFSPSDGPLHQWYDRQGISVVIDPEMRLGRLDCLRWKEFDFVWVNTILFAYLLQRRRCQITIFWWIHEAEKFYADMDLCLTENEWKKVHAFCVSELAARNFCRLVPGGSRHMEGIFPYGIPDVAGKTGEFQPHETMVFAIVGTLGQIKGQAFFLSVWRKRFLSDASVELWLIGSGTKGEELQEIQIAARDCRNVRFLGELSHDAVCKLYSEIDILVCPSQDDPLPVVATEAMMNYRPCLVSDHTGTADFITHGVDGWVFRAGDARDLEDKLLDVVAQKEHLSEMGRQARLCYEKYFSYDAFERRVLKAAQYLMKGWDAGLSHSMMRGSRNV